MRKSLALAAAALFAATTMAGAETPLPVEIVTVQALPVDKEFHLFGTIKAANSYPVAFRTGGRVTEIDVEVGDTVPAGEVIARIDPANAQSNLAAAEAALEAAEAVLSQAAQARARAQDLLERGAGTQAQLDQAEEAYVSAQSSRDQAQAQLSQAQQAVDDTVIRTIEDVIVIERSAEPGEVVGAGQAVVTLASQGHREAVFYVPDIAEVSEASGKSVTLSPSGGNETFAASVSEVSPVLNAAGAVEVKAALPDDAGEPFAIGTTVEGRISLTSAPVISVPWTALTATAQGPAVWTVDPETMAVALTPITIASFADTSIAVAGGLSDGDLVVGAGSVSLYPGRVVEAAGADQ